MNVTSILLFSMLTANPAEFALLGSSSIKEPAALFAPAVAIDGDLTTCWEPRADDPAPVLELDFAAVLDSGIAVGPLTITGVAPGLRMQLQSGDGRLTPYELGNRITLSANGARYLQLQFDNAADTSICELSLGDSEQLPIYWYTDEYLNSEFFELPLQPDVAAFPVRGVVEGYYGPPLTHRERLNYLRLMRALGLNTFIYGPKYDTLHRQDWRVAYGDEQLADFAELIEVADENGVDFCYAISPGLDIDSYDDSDFAALTEKLSQLTDLGASCLALHLDDIPTDPTAETGQAHRFLTDRVYEWAAGRGVDRFYMVPTVYRGLYSSLASGPTEYLTEIGQIEPEVEIMYTGGDTFDVNITLEEAQAAADILQRPALIWDNYPVNDFSVFGQLFMAPIGGRGTELAGNIAGILSNPMQQASASLMAIYSYADYFVDGEVSEDADLQAADLLTPGYGEQPADPQPLLMLAKHCYNHQLVTPDRQNAPELKQALTDYIDNPADYTARDELARLLAQYAVLPSRLANEVRQPDLLNELMPFAVRLASFGRAGLAWLKYIDLTGRGDSSGAENYRRQAEEISANRIDESINLADNLFDDFFTSAVSEATAVAIGEEMSNCGGEDNVEVFGSPEPIALPGRYLRAAITTGDRGFHYCLIENYRSIDSATNNDDSGGCACRLSPDEEMPASTSIIILMLLLCGMVFHRRAAITEARSKISSLGSK